MQVHLVDGTYELFRHYYALPEHRSAAGLEVAAARGVLGSLLSLLEDGATHVGVATDRVIESFRNELYDGYKTGEGIDPELFDQFRPLEDAVEAAGFALFPMVEFEADDGLAAAAALADAHPDVERVWICTPDKDLAQCVRGERVVQLDRRQNKRYDAEGVREKFGVTPASIPDYLALVGDSADGFPGLPGWGAKSAATGAGPLRPDRGDPGQSRGLGRAPARCGAARGHAGRESRRGPALPAAGHPGRRRARGGTGRGLALARAARARGPRDDRRGGLAAPAGAIGELALAGC